MVNSIEFENVPFFSSKAKNAILFLWIATFISLILLIVDPGPPLLSVSTQELLMKHNEANYILFGQRNTQPEGLNEYAQYASNKWLLAWAWKWGIAFLILLPFSIFYTVWQAVIFIINISSYSLFKIVNSAKLHQQISTSCGSFTVGQLLTIFLLGVISWKLVDFFFSKWKRK